MKIDETGDLVIGEDGILETLSGAETTAQNIRMTLKAEKGDFPLVPGHGTNYETILKEDTDLQSIEEEYRESIYQETGISMVEEIKAKKENRELRVTFRAVTKEGETIESEVIR